MFAETTRPPLTTVDMCLTELGQFAARRLLARIEGDRSRGVEQFPCRLVIRESTGADVPPQAPRAVNVTENS